MRPSGPDSGSADGGPLLWPSTTSGSPAEPQVSLALAWLLSHSELFAVRYETLYYTVELFEVADPLGTTEAWVGASGPRYQGAPLPPVTPAVQARVAAAELAAHIAVILNGTAVSPSAARLLSTVETSLLGFGMTYTDRADGSEAFDISAYLVVPAPLDATVRSPLAVRPVFARLTARDTRGGRPLLVRTSNLRWLLPGPPPSVAAAPAPPDAAASSSQTASPSAVPPELPLPAAFDAHTACTAWKALRLNPATWNRGLPQCPQSVAQLSRSQWVPVSECSQLNGSVAAAGGGSGAADAWGTAPCWAQRGRAAFGEVDARSCFVSAVANSNYAAAACCYDAAGRLLRTGAGSASDARFAPSPARLSHVFADQLPRLVYCRLSSTREDCDGVVRTTGGFS